MLLLLSRVRLFATPRTAAHQASLSITNSRSLLKLMSIESVMPSSHLTLYRPLLLSPSLFPSSRVFSNESAVSCNQGDEGHRKALCPCAPQRPPGIINGGSRLLPSSERCSAFRNGAQLSPAVLLPPPQGPQAAFNEQSLMCRRKFGFPVA